MAVDIPEFHNDYIDVILFSVLSERPDFDILSGTFPNHLQNIIIFIYNNKKMQEEI